MRQRQEVWPQHARYAALRQLVHNDVADRLMTTVSQDDQVKAYIKKIMSQLNKWMHKSKISKLVIVITSKDLSLIHI